MNSLFGRCFFRKKSQCGSTWPPPLLSGSKHVQLQVYSFSQMLSSRQLLLFHKCLASNTNKKLLVKKWVTSAAWTLNFGTLRLWASKKTSSPNMFDLVGESRQRKRRGAKMRPLRHPHRCFSGEFGTFPGGQYFLCPAVLPLEKPLGFSGGWFN